MVRLSEKPYVLRRWASAVGVFTAVDLDCSLPPIFGSGDPGKPLIMLEGGDIITVVKDVYSMKRQKGPILLNSLGTLQAAARASGGERDWSFRFLKYVIYLASACRARADSSLFILNSFRDASARGLLGVGWVKLCSTALDGTWSLTEDGLNRVS